ncbi:fructuronate reductase [Rhodococcus sp. 06-412-2C]|uniref:mannitol dehydrogenase family protein n=1 Tax=unclassified Rhodococcus (in: high G+C Gram-positive bacteria) TaxID=192944 RepID=UPI000B9BA478|nr:MULTISPECIES: mannitol dehydrogenase family protein [unclassified Rhodococcus (in: high G+C Gram-positive bacteria)]OZC91597.1 fructuronate reductase [Rhodococcus sp. 06-412-2C]OZC92164.1 fructuronate reductase [Rhodococcus sp. 06-412-2B]
MIEPRLSRSALAGSGLVPVRPDGTGIVHLGLGNFHRAHQAVYTAAALERDGGSWGILGVANRSRTVTDAMLAQDLLYGVVEISPSGSRVGVPGAHTGVMVAAHDPAAVVAAIADQNVRIVTITVTELGYTFSSKTGVLDLESTAVQQDLSRTETPTTTIGQLARSLAVRARTHGAPITVASCDNLLGNGDRTAALVRQFLTRCGADDVIDWLATAVTFPNSMVDRIVPSSRSSYDAESTAGLGAVDTIAVPAEPFTMWVMEDKFAAGRPRWEAGGAVFAEDVEPYELMKVRLLNGTHSLIAYLGALDGCATIPDSIGRPFVEAAARAVLVDEYLPTVPVPDGVDIDDYIAQLFVRWSNSALGHKTAQVGSDGSAKLAQRIPTPALYHLRNGAVPQYLSLTLAAYLCCMCPPDGFDPGPHARAMADPARVRLAGLAASAASSEDFVRSVLERGDILPIELTSFPEFITRTAELVDTVVRHGPMAAVVEAASSSLRPVGTASRTTLD